MSCQGLTVATTRVILNAKNVTRFRKLSEWIDARDVLIVPDGPLSGLGEKGTAMEPRRRLGVSRAFHRSGMARKKQIWQDLNEWRERERADRPGFCDII